MPGNPAALDETGYFFLPGAHGFDFNAYIAGFSGRSRKKIAREREAFEKMGIAFSQDILSHVDLLFRMNLSQFGDRSYFSDPRFLSAFESLTALLQASGCLRLMAHKSGTLKEIDTRRLMEDPRVRDLHLSRKPGHRIEMPPEDYDTRWLGYPASPRAGPSPPI